MSVYRSLLKELKAGGGVVMLTVLEEGNQGAAQPEKVCFTRASLEGPRPGGSAGPEAGQLAREALATGELRVAAALQRRVLVAEPFFPLPRLIVFGAGHIGKALCEFGSRLGFLVTVVDDRAEFANRERLPGADQVICDRFDRSFEGLQFGPHTYVVVVTRGHLHDTACLREVLKRSWAYAGMIGSRRRVQGVREMLISEGAPRDVVEKVNAPVGLDIGALTPEEITVSILAQVISYLRLEDPGKGRESPRIKWTEFDRDVMEDLALGSVGDRAAATVISTAGSAPRRAGAKMLVWPDGRILGSVGGGGGEGVVIEAAREVIRSGGYRVQAIDMSGSFMEEGMVCGGSMQVLIEAVKGGARP